MRNEDLSLSKKKLSTKNCILGFADAKEEEIIGKSELIFSHQREGT